MESFPLHIIDDLVRVASGPVEFCCVDMHDKRQSADLLRLDTRWIGHPIVAVDHVIIVRNSDELGFLAELISERCLPTLQENS